MSETKIERIRAGSVLRVGAVCAVTAALSWAAIGPAGAAPSPRAGKAVVVKVSASRGGFKKVLTNTVGVGATLYTASSCSGSCLSSWPPLLMPKGKTTPAGPKGLAGLGTAKLGSRLQVTYKHHRLYTYVGDSGTSVTGNGVFGFTVIDNV